MSRFYSFVRRSLMPATLALFMVCLPTSTLAQRSLLLPMGRAWANAYNAGNFKEALKIARQAQALATKESLKKGEMSVVLYDIGETLRCMGFYGEAEETLKKALADCDETPSKLGNNIATPNVYNSLPMIYETLGRYTEAEGLWQQCELLTRRNPNFVYLPINHLAHLYCTWGKLDQCQAYVKKAGEAAERAPKTAAVPYAAYSYAMYAQARGNYKEAQKAYKLALEACAVTFSKSHPYYARVLAEQAELFRQQSKYTAAEESMRAALKINQDTYPEDHPETAEMMVNLARILSDEGRYTEAQSIAKKALKTEETAYGSVDNLFVAKARGCLGNIARQEGRYQDAKDLLSSALSAQQHILGKDNVDVATTMRDLAMVQEDMGEYADAEAMLKSAIEIIKQKTGPDHPQRAAAANALAHFYLRDGRFDQAQPLLTEALSMSQKVMGEDNAVTAGSAHDLGELYSKQKDWANAQKYLQEALAIDEKLYGEKAAQVAADCIYLSTAYGAEGQADKAEVLLKRVAEIKNVLPGGASTNGGTLSGVAVDLDGAVPSGKDRPVADKWALVVGISNFKDPTINLKYAAKDATDFKNFLVASEHFKADHVKLLTNEKAYRENIIGMLGEKWLGAHVKPDDLVVVYVSSHGSQAQGEAGGVNFLVAHDTNKNSLPATGIPMQWLSNIIKDQVHADRVVLILDVCHSGSAGDGGKGLSRTDSIDLSGKRLKIGAGQMVICSSAKEQVSWESKNYENSVFTRKLMDALQTSKDKTTIGEAYKQLKVMVEAEVLKDRGDLQTPILYSKTWTGADPVLAVKSSK